MSELVINGGNSLYGQVNIQGAKNSVLPILAATLLCNGSVILHNCPHLSDVTAALNILKHIGCNCDVSDNTICVDTKIISCNTIPDNLMREMRSSVIFLGAILGKCHNAIISTPGGCELGPRPIDLHISALKKLGVVVCEKHGFMEFSAPKGIIGAKINLSFASVGATENIILAAVLAKGVTTIHNAAKEPEICDLAQFLNVCGAKIYGAGTDTITICGVDSLHGCEHTVIPDRIVAATYMAAAALSGGKVVLSGVIPKHLMAVNSIFEESGCDLNIYDNVLTISAPKRLKSVSTIRTAVYPGFPTDAGPLVLAMLTKSIGTTVMVENIFENRYRYIDELRRFGAKVNVEGRVAIIEGVDNLSGASCRCTDLRGGAALVIVALCAVGTTTVGDIYHIKRGYENIIRDFSALGADIKEI